MSFSWSSLPKKAQKVVVANQSKFTELRNNVNTLCDNISISRPILQQFGGLGDPLLIYGLQDEIDRVDDENYCRTNNVTYDLTFHTDDDFQDYASQNSSECGTYYGGVDNTHFGNVMAINNAADRGSDCAHYTIYDLGVKTNADGCS